MISRKSSFLLNFTRFFSLLFQCHFLWDGQFCIYGVFFIIFSPLYIVGFLSLTLQNHAMCVDERAMGYAQKSRFFKVFCTPVCPTELFCEMHILQKMVF